MQWKNGKRLKSIQKVLFFLDRFGGTRVTLDCCLMPRLVRVIGDSLSISNATHELHENEMCYEYFYENVVCNHDKMLNSTKLLTIRAFDFLAPSGAQGVTMSVCLSVGHKVV